MMTSYFIPSSPSSYIPIESKAGLGITSAPLGYVNAAPENAIAVLHENISRSISVFPLIERA
jgi:hypothetical protein